MAIFFDVGRRLSTLLEECRITSAPRDVDHHAAKIAQALGAKQVVGIAGGPQKCRHPMTEMSYDHVVDYKNDDINSALDIAFPEGVDLCLDNVGGPLLDRLLG